MGVPQGRNPGEFHPGAFGDRRPLPGAPDDQRGDSELRRTVERLAKTQEEQSAKFDKFMDSVMKSIATIPREPRAPEAHGSYVPEGAGSRDAGDLPTRAQGSGHPIYSEANPFVTGVSSSGFGAVGAADATAWNTAANSVAYGPNFGRDPTTTPLHRPKRRRARTEARSQTSPAQSGTT